MPKEEYLLPSALAGRCRHNFLRCSSDRISVTPTRSGMNSSMSRLAALLAYNARRSSSLIDSTWKSYHNKKFFYLHYCLSQCMRNESICNLRITLIYQCKKKSLQHNHIIFLPFQANSTLHKVSLTCCWLLSRHIRSTQQFQNWEGLLQLSVVTLMTRYIWHILCPPEYSRYGNTCSEMVHFARINWLTKHNGQG